MLIYLLVILLILLLQNRLLGLPEGVLRDKTERRYLRIVCYILVLLAALRGSSVGTDTHNYILFYRDMPYVTFGQVLEENPNYPGYFLLAKACSFLNFPIQILFGIVEGLYLFAVYKFINKFSTGKLYSILCFMAIGLYTFTLAGLKQTLSMAFVLFYYVALTDKKYIRVVLWGWLAYLCHHVSLVFLFGVVLYFIRNLKAYYLYLTFLVLFMLYGTSYLWTNMLELLENDHYSKLYMADEGYSSTTMFFYGVLVFLLFLCSRNYGKTKKVESRIMLGFSTMAFACQAFSFVSSTAFRLSYFFVPFMIVGFPNEFNCIENADTKRILKFVVAFIIVFFFFYTARNTGGYKFFWNDWM